MKLNRLLGRLTLMGILTCSAFTASAGLLDNIQKGFENVIDFITPYKGPKKDITTLIITSNYVKSKMLAELIQFDTKQPYILLPAAGQDKIYFCPAHGYKPQEIKKEKLERFIKFVNPRQILVLGDESYVPEKYLKMIDENQTLWVVSNRNWNQTAKSVGKLLNLSNIADDYKRTLSDWQSGQRYVPEQTQIPLKQLDVNNSSKVEVKEEKIVTTESISVPSKQQNSTAAPTIEEPEIIMDEPEIIIPDEDPVIIKE